ncbi:hypothetical protein J2S43_006321 [Catenuloplanes nepalensis]|uniref:Class I SAM-dependent methyltransferase n=1 Tax=Catenuloplanes nepalensis TaxID=587533 RepID=A0ABT9N289_9ACTN|nr:hypothetical protein [Catenuloplanes nepalensis]MDP9797809.1 hypothetical protein [Catenuloplanes nepalensis]
MFDRPAALLPEPAHAAPEPPIPGQINPAAAALANLSRIGGEMFAWSDPAHGCGGALRHLLRTLVPAPGAHVLVAGPHHDELITLLHDAGATVTCLVRSLGDAEALALRFPAAGVLCGDAARLDPSTRYDLVICLDGLERLNSTEGTPRTDDELLATLAKAVAPDGTLVLRHENPLGVHTAVELDPGARERDDSAWYPPGSAADRPASLAELTTRLAIFGLHSTAGYAAFPTPANPTVLVGPGLLGEAGAPLRGPLQAVLARAFTDAYRDRPVLSDPRRMAGRVLRAGAEAVLAPAWVTVSRASGEVPSHALLAGDTDGPHAYTLTPADWGATATTLVPADESAARGGLRRVNGSFPVPAGVILEERLLGLCARADLSGLRTELRRLAAWLDGHAREGWVTGPMALADAGELLDDGTRLGLAPPRWAPDEPIAVDTVLTRVAWRFAARLITSGQPHPWPITSSAVDLAGLLLGMIDRPLREESLRAAIAIELDLSGLPLPERDGRRRELLALAPGAATIDVPGYRELAEALWRQRYQVSHLLAQMEWTEQIIRSRDLHLSKMDWEIQLYRRSWPGRFLMVARSGYKLVRSDTRKLSRRISKRRAAARRAKRDPNFPQPGDVI